MVGQITHVFSATQAEATSNSAGAATTWVGPNEWNSAHELLMTLTGSTAGSSTVSGTNIILGASQNLTVSGTSNSVYLVGPQLSAWFIGEGTSVSYDATSMAASSGSIFGALFVLPTELAMTRLDVFGSQILSNATFAATSAASRTSSTTGQTWILAGLWSRQGGANSGTLTLLTSTQMEIQYSATLSESSSSASGFLSVTWSTGIPQASVSQTFNGSKSTSAGWTTITAGNSGSWSGNFDLPFPFAGTLEPGEYFFGMNVVTSGSSGAGPRLAFSFNKQVGSLQMGYMGNNPGNNVPGLEYLQGLAMTNGSSAAMPASYIMSNLSPNTLGQPMAQLVNYGTATNLL